MTCAIAPRIGGGLSTSRYSSDSLLPPPARGGLRLGGGNSAGYPPARFRAHVQTQRDRHTSQSKRSVRMRGRQLVAFRHFCCLPLVVMP